MNNLEKALKKMEQRTVNFDGSGVLRDYTDTLYDLDSEIKALKIKNNRSKTNFLDVFQIPDDILSVYGINYFKYTDNYIEKDAKESFDEYISDDRGKLYQLGFELFSFEENYYIYEFVFFEDVVQTISYDRGILKKFESKKECALYVKILLDSKTTEKEIVGKGEFELGLDLFDILEWAEKGTAYGKLTNFLKEFKYVNSTEINYAYLNSLRNHSEYVDFFFDNGNQFDEKEFNKYFDN